MTTDVPAATAKPPTMSAPSLNDYMAQCRNRCTAQLTALLDDRYPASHRLHEAMRYSLLSSGKRLRPVLVYATADSLAKANPVTDRLACAVEAIHAYSLIHDDLPAMDDDALRRGQPTCHIAFDEATAILAGDALQCLAFELVTDTEINAETAVQALRNLSRAAGAGGMVLGQAIDLAAVDRELTLPELQRMHGLKTGALIEASVVLGALSVEADPARIESLRRFARAIGLAFQVQDDILDVTADTQTLGKSQGADARNNKPTYVSLLGLDGARQKAQELLGQALASLQPLALPSPLLADLARFIVARKR